MHFWGELNLLQEVVSWYVLPMPRATRYLQIIVDGAQKDCSYRRFMEKSELGIPGQDPAWVVRETTVSYEADLAKGLAFQGAQERPSKG